MNKKHTFLFVFLGLVLCTQALHAADPEASTAYGDEIQTTPANHNGGRLGIQPQDRVEDSEPQRRPQFAVNAEPRGPKTGYNMGVMAGASLWQDMRYESSAPRYDESTKLGPYFGVKFGYDWPFDDEPLEQWRREAGPEGVRVSGGIEAEAFFLQNDFDANAVAGRVKSDFYTGAGMVNVLLKLQWGNFRPYFGPGIGLAYTFTDKYSAPGATGSRKDSDVNLAWQIVGGMDYFINEDWSVFGEYKFLDIHDLNVYGPTSPINGKDYYQQIFSIGLRKHF